MNKSDLVLRTSEAALALGCSTDTLKRKRESQGGFLEAGVHYFYGDCTFLYSIHMEYRKVQRSFS